MQQILTVKVSYCDLNFAFDIRMVDLLLTYEWQFSILQINDQPYF